MEEKLHALPISEIVSGCKSGDILPRDIINAYGKKALQAQSRTNCVSELMLDEASRSVSVQSWGSAIDSDSYTSDLVRDRPLLGVPISVKGA